MLYVIIPAPKFSFRAFLATLPFMMMTALTASSAHAFQKEIPFSLGDVHRAARDAEKSNQASSTPDLGPTRLELITKNNLIEMKFKNPKKFEEIRQNRLENSLLYQSWVDEVNEALSERPLPRTLSLRKNETPLQKFYEGSKIDLAKKIAKKELFLSLQRYWPWLKDTIFNEFDAHEWHHAKPSRPSPEAAVSLETPSGSEFTVSKLNEMFRFSPNNSNSKNFEFDFDFSGRNFVEINRNTLRQGRVGLDINSDHDVNRLEPGADKIQADNADQAPDTSGSPGAPQDEGVNPPSP